MCAGFEAEGGVGLKVRKLSRGREKRIEGLRDKMKKGFYGSVYPGGGLCSKAVEPRMRVRESEQGRKV